LKRDLHKIFQFLDKENPTEKKWYICITNDDIKGPYNTFEMD